jgi:hypothetical protein
MPKADSQGVYRLNSLQEAGKPATTGLGKLESLVLLYASTTAWRFTPSDIALRALTSLISFTRDKELPLSIRFSLKNEIEIVSL